MVTHTGLRDSYCARLVATHLTAKIQPETSFVAFQRKHLTTETMSVINEDWQTTRPTIRERSKFMFNNNLFSDVEFVVQKAAQDGSESKQVIPAHKFVLSISSPVFEAMFYGELAETTDSIELPDCEYDSLLELFRYMYSDEAMLSESNVMEVLYLATKYMVPSLAAKCTDYLQDNLDPSNVFSILPSAQKYEEKSLVHQCWEVIDIQTEEAVKSDGFAAIERSLLEAVVVRDTLTIEEIELFKAVDLWATKECERQGLAADGASKRRILQERVIKGIRFPTMKLEEFAGVVMDADILTKEEVFSIIKRLSLVSSSSVGFPETKRCGFYGNMQRCYRLDCLDSARFEYADKTDAISFSVDRDIVFHGVALFGEKDSTYSVKLDVMDSYTKSICVSKTGEFSSELLQGKNSSYEGYIVSFEEKVILKKNKNYVIRAKISGPDSLYGVSDYGGSSVQCSGVTFTFMNSEYSDHGTHAYGGQFPELLFSLYKQ